MVKSLLHSVRVVYITKFVPNRHTKSIWYLACGSEHFCLKLTTSFSSLFVPFTSCFACAYLVCCLVRHKKKNIPRNCGFYIHLPENYQGSELTHKQTKERYHEKVCEITHVVWKKILLIFTVRKRSCEKVMFSRLCICPWEGCVSPACTSAGVCVCGQGEGYGWRGVDRGCTPPIPKMATEVGGMHPTGMHSCFLFISIVVFTFDCYCFTAHGQKFVSINMKW